MNHDWVTKTDYVHQCSRCQAVRIENPVNGDVRYRTKDSREVDPDACAGRPPPFPAYRAIAPSIKPPGPMTRLRQQVVHAMLGCGASMCLICDSGYPGLTARKEETESRLPLLLEFSYSDLVSADDYVLTLDVPSDAGTFRYRIPWHAILCAQLGRNPHAGQVTFKDGSLEAKELAHAAERVSKVITMANHPAAKRRKKDKQ